MGRQSSSLEFRPEVFLRSVERLHDSTFVLDELLCAVVNAITTKYDHFLGHLRTLEIFPLLVTCPLFGARFFRSDLLNYGPVTVGDGPPIAGVCSIAHLEDSGVIFLTEPQQTLSGSGQSCCFPYAPHGDSA